MKPLSISSLTCQFLAVILIFINITAVKAEDQKRFLFVISAHEYGYYLPELVTPYRILADANIQIDIASPQGKPGTAAAKSRLNRIDKKYFSLLSEQLQTPLSLESINTSRYEGVYFVGGSGPMMDLYNHTQVNRIVTELNRLKKVISADCHGPVALAAVKLANGELFVKGRKITAKSNAEEGYWAASHYPFLLEDKLKENKALFSAAKPGSPYIVVDGNLLTGQNPASAEILAKKIVSLVNNL